MSAVFLIGYRATGKSSVGRLLAARLEVPFADTDRTVEAKSGLSIAELFSQRGEEAFRDRESEALRDICLEAEGEAGLVVATGGGIVLRPQNRSAMRAAGRVVWLTASPPTIRARLEADPSSGRSRPPLSGSSALLEVEEVLGAREPLYREAAEVAISTEGRGQEAVALAVLDWLQRPSLARP